MELTERTHHSAKTASQDTSSLTARIGLNRKGSNPVPLHTWVARLMAEWLPDGGGVADVGCGTGLLGAALAEECANVGGRLGSYVGVDPSSSHGPAFAANAPHGSRFETLTLAEWIGTSRADYDAVACVFSLYYHETHDLPGLVGELLDRVNRHGRLVICGPIDPNNREWFEVLQDECGVGVPPRMLYESYDYMHDVVGAVSRCGRDFRASRYRNSVTMTPAQVHDYWRSVIYHDADHDEAVDRRFAKGVTINKEVLYLEVAGPPA